MKNQMKPLPNRPAIEFKYTDKKDRKMVSVRLPEALISRLKTASDDTGFSATELIQYAVDQLMQTQDKASK